MSYQLDLDFNNYTHNEFQSFNVSFASKIALSWMKKIIKNAIHLIDIKFGEGN